jgi:hypothetical protein
MHVEKLFDLHAAEMRGRGHKHLAPFLELILCTSTRRPSYESDV